MLGIITLCLEKDDILFNQPDREWVAISMHSLKTGIQRLQTERSSWAVGRLLVPCTGGNLCLECPRA